MLSDSQRAALAARLRKGRGSATIPRRDPNLAELQLSTGQEQLWFIDQFAPGLATYNIPGALRMTGPLDVRALNQAIGALTARHESLRTRLVSFQGQPVQVIDPPTVTVLAVEDISADPASQPQTRCAERAVEYGLEPFDLAKGPLFRTRLLRLADQEHVLLVNVHHSVADGWSFDVLFRELAAFYRTAVEGGTTELPEMPIQFADYAVWERARLDGEAMAEHVAYWTEALRGVGSVQMPTDRPRPVLQSFDGAMEQMPMGADVLKGLRALSRQAGTTIFVVLLTSLQVLLHRYSGSDDLVVGTASANRSRAELAGLIGYLVNTLPIRTDTSGDPTFEELLAQVKETTLAAYAHQDLPFPRLVEELRVERDASRAPLFQIGFTIVEQPEGELTAVDGLDWKVEPVVSPTAKFDLNFFMRAYDDFPVELYYAVALFDPETVRRLLTSLRVLMAAAATDPSRRLSQLPVMTDEDLQRELVEWNSNTMEFPVTCLHELVEQQAARVPTSTAAVYESSQLTYAELNGLANRVARHLRALGVGPETLVGVHMRPSLERLAGLLGILKAGGAYVPLDPDYPAERLAFMIDDAQVGIVLSDPAEADGLEQFNVTVVLPEQVWPTLSGLPDGNLGPSATPGNAAYVIYTSGSTGRPKGVTVEHAQVVNFVQGMVAHWLLDEHDNFLQFASLNFDVSVMDLFLALGSGGTAVFGSRETLLSPPRLAALMRRERVSFACLPPAVLNLLTGEEFPDQRVLISAGEELSTELVRKWLRPGLRMYNGYGPTEATIGATMMELRPDDITPPPIGMPKPNYRAYVLDRHLNPVPVGVAGELHIGGPGVARGYLNRPDLTAERFIDDPFSSAPGARMYKTGDLVRHRPDGNILFLGRIDGQVKIRGLRVELGEIETTMMTHEAVVQAVVVVGTDAAGEKQLIGYARPDPAQAWLSVADLRQHLSLRLPGYMVPAHLMLLDVFPLNASGKIDRKALPEPTAAEAAGSVVAPRTLIETILVDTYAMLLKTDRVGIDDSFFDLGGNSLLAMRLITQLRDDLAVDADVTAVFLAPTPSQLAVLMRDKYGLEDMGLDDEDADRLDGLGGLAQNDLASAAE